MPHIPSSYPVDYHPQVTFHQISASEGIVYKAANYRTGTRPQPVEVTASTLENLRIGNQLVWEIRDEMGVKAGNQWLDVFPDGKSRALSSYSRALIAQLGGDLAAAAKSTAITRADTCGGIAALAYHKLLQKGLNAPVSYAGTDEHAYPVIGDHRIGKLIKVDVWTPIPFAHVMSDEEVARTHFFIPATLGEPIPDDLSGGLPRIDAGALDKFATDVFDVPVGPSLLQRIIDLDAGQLASGKENEVWHELFGPEDPNTRYTVQGETTFPVTFDRIPVKYWQENIGAKQDLIDDYVVNHPGILEAAGYAADGSSGAG